MSKIDQPSALSKIAEYLKENEFPTYLPEPVEETPFEQLYVAIGQDKDKRHYILQVAFVNDLAAAAGVQEESEDAMLLQFFHNLPFVAEQDKVAEVSMLILTLNRVLPLGAFGISQKEGAVYFQYVLASETREVSAKVVLEVTSIISMFVMELSPKIESIATGEQTYESVIAELEKTGLNIPSIVPMPTPEQ